MAKVEQVARAIWTEWHGPEGQLKWEDIPEASRDLGRRLARAAIEAMRKPTKAMLNRGWGEMSATIAVDRIYDRMIDAALSETETTR